MKKKYLLTFPLLILFSSPLYAQAPDTLWTRTYGGDSSDVAYSLQQTTDGGYIVVGYTKSYGAGSSDVWLLKTDANGDTLWSKTFGGSALDAGYSVQQTTDGGYIIVGFTTSYGAGSQILLIKTDVNGDTTWTRTYGGANDEKGWDVEQTSDQGYIFTGTSGTTYNSRVYIVKTNANGDTLWTRRYGDYAICYGRSIQQTYDGGYIIAGNHSDPCGDYFQIYLIKTDSLGDSIWSKIYGQPILDRVAYSAQETSDHGFIIAGYTEPTASKYDVYLVRTNEIGDTLWTKSYGESDDDRGWDVQQTSDQGYVIVGECVLSGSSKDVYIIKTDTNGDTLWTKTYGGTSNDGGYSIQQIQDSLYVIAGYTESFGAGSADAWLIEMEPDVGVEEENIVIGKNNFGTTIISGPLRLPKGKKCKVYDISGRSVDVNRIKPGIYFIETEGRISHKVVKIK
ncbi:MAG TPA: hypothetical protein EYP58_01270 [bacterium (Candidatus Stahlbacteria)]|nr:hypothetical protein [Candidatus Stahlbacteria bacterium]